MKNFPEQLGLNLIKHKDYFEISNNDRSIFILTKKYKFGINTFIGDRVKICNIDGRPMENIQLGDNVTIHNDSVFMIPELKIQDYTKINNHFYVHGDKPLLMGYNCWIGSSVIMDTLGGLKLGDNVGIGSQSQIYSHAKFGDTLYGCRINSVKAIFLANDAWIAANTIITLASVAEKSMLLAGSVLTKDTYANHIYAGIPAEDITKKVGKQFAENPSFDQIYRKMLSYLKQFYRDFPQFKRQNLIEICCDFPSKIDPNKTYFIIKERKYIKTLSQVEIQFIKYLLPEKAKFTPYSS